MPVVHVRLSDAQHKVLQDIADREDLPLAVTIRALAMASAAITTTAAKTAARQTSQLDAKTSSNVVAFRPVPKPGKTTKR